MPSLFFKSQERDLGPIVHWGCPRCIDESTYHLVVKSGSFSFAGLGGLKTGDLLDARCTTCGFEIGIDKSDASVLPVLHEKTRLFLQGDMAKEEYRKQLIDFDCTLICGLQALSDEWECPTCGEMNPVNFLQCWSCGYDRESGVLNSNESSELMSEDMDVGGNHPWEG